MPIPVRVGIRWPSVPNHSCITVRDGFAIIDRAIHDVREESVKANMPLKKTHSVPLTPGVHAADYVTEIRRQAALLQTGALQSAIFNSANFSSIATDANGVIQIFNVGAARMLGYDAADVMNKITPADISDPAELVARTRALSEEFDAPIAPGFEALSFKASRGIEDIYELTYIRKDGSRLPAVVSVTALRDAEDGIIGYLLIGTDNTARKQAEEALVQAGALQNAIFGSSSFSSIATDARGIIQIFNVGAERMLGYVAGDVVNQMTPADFSDPEELVARAQALELELGAPIAPGFEALSFKATRGIEDIYALTYIRKDGSRLPAVVSVTALRDTRSAIIGYLLIGTDNTARKLLADERARHLDHLEELVASRTAELSESRDAAQASTRAKSIFLANMSHEIRTPMNAILGLSHLALQTALEEKPRGYVQKVHDAAENLLGIINGILDFSKAEAGSMRIERQAFVLADVLDRALVTSGVEARAKGLAMELEVDPGVPEVLLGDAMRLGQVLLNLCANAIRFTATGHVRLLVDLVHQDPNDIELQFRVADTGQGVATDKLKLIFEQFTQADTSTTRSHGGSGLGLTISRQLVELMGGQLEVSSELGVGSTFCFNACFGNPAAQPGDLNLPASATASAAPEAALRGAKILLAEDNEVNQLIVCEILRGAGAEVWVAPDGRQAVTLMGAHPDIDLVLMDCHMPGMDGFAATRAIRADPRWAHVPVLAMTASVFPDDLLACQAAGMDDHVEKPFVVSRLFEILAHWLQCGARRERSQPF